MLSNEGAASTSSTTESDMRSLIRLLVLLAICFVGIGLYLGWFGLSRQNATPETEGNKVNLNVSIDKDKMKSDVKKAKEKVKEEIKELKGKGPAGEAK
jgi:hypothetical protein